MRTEGNCMTDEELAAAIEDAREGVAEGRYRLCGTAEELHEELRRRFGR